MNKETLYPGSFQYQPMLYCGKPTKTAIKQAFESGKFFAGEKLDGALYQIEKTDNGQVYMFSRTKSKKTGELAEKGANFPHIVDWAKTFLPKSTILVGEVYVPGGHSNTVTKISGCLPAKAYSRQFDETNPDYVGAVHYYVFDILRFEGENLINKPAIERAEKYLWGEKIGYSFADQEYVHRQEIIYDNFEEKLQEIFARGGEGLVFKAKDCPYRVGKRSTASQAFKWKQSLDTIDVICLGFEKPTYFYSGKDPDNWKYKDEDGNLITRFAYYNYPAAIKMGLYKDGKIVEVGTVSSGLSDFEREDIRDNPEKWINKVIECSAMSISKESAFRHCVFIQIRNDKNPEECLWEDIFKC